jgi:hypothetical protein
MNTHLRLLTLQVDRTSLNANLLTPERDKCVTSNEYFTQKYGLEYSEDNCGMSHAHYVHPNCTVTHLLGLKNGKCREASSAGAQPLVFQRWACVRACPETS